VSVILQIKKLCQGYWRKTGRRLFSRSSSNHGGSAWREFS